MKITFVTTNLYKFEEAQSIFSESSFELVHYNLALEEIQSNNIDNISIEKANKAYKRLKVPIIVDDTGLYIDQLKGFPGPYASFVAATLGTSGLAQLIKPQMGAIFKTVTTYKDADDVIVTTGEVRGTIHAKFASKASKFSDMFIPEGERVTLALLGRTYPAHRKLALNALIEELNRRN